MQSFQISISSAKTRRKRVGLRSTYYPTIGYHQRPMSACLIASCHSVIPAIHCFHSPNTQCLFVACFEIQIYFYLYQLGPLLMVRVLSMRLLSFCFDSRWWTILILKLKSYYAYEQNLVAPWESATHYRAFLINAKQSEIRIIIIIFSFFSLTSLCFHTDGQYKWGGKITNFLNTRTKTYAHWSWSLSIENLNFEN